MLKEGVGLRKSFNHRNEACDKNGNDKVAW